MLILAQVVEHAPIARMSNLCGLSQQQHGSVSLLRTEGSLLLCVRGFAQPPPDPEELPPALQVLTEHPLELLGIEKFLLVHEVVVVVVVTGSAASAAVLVVKVRPVLVLVLVLFQLDGRVEQAIASVAAASQTYADIRMKEIPLL